MVYIITNQERAAFERLRTDGERAHFVEQFWERRNPTPGARDNPFKTEHYRRIAFANDHFASDIPGWKTDRGHIYIVYGPPDEIESHLKTANKAYGVEVWRYRHVKGVGENGLFEFADQTGTGDYRLAPVTPQ